MGLASPAGRTGKGPAWVLTHHGEGADTGLHGAFVLLLQPWTLQQPRGGLQQLHHNCLVCLQEKRTGGSSATPPRWGTGTLTTTVCLWSRQKVTNWFSTEQPP